MTPILQDRSCFLSQVPQLQMPIEGLSQYVISVLTLQRLCEAAHLCVRPVRLIVVDAMLAVHPEIRAHDVSAPRTHDDDVPIG